ncbi:MAG: hypothetical protein P8X63_10160, partial [Desulfuromonadaceae bacterium]
MMPGDLGPEPLGGEPNQIHQRALHRNREIVPGRQPQFAVIQDIDPADKSDFPVDHHNLPMHPAQTFTLQGPGRDSRPIEQYPDPALAQPRQQTFVQIFGAETIQQHPNRHPARCRPQQGFGYPRSGGIMAIDVAFQIDFMYGPVTGLFKSRKIGGAGVQQGNPVVRHKTGPTRGQNRSVPAGTMSFPRGHRIPQTNRTRHSGTAGGMNVALWKGLPSRLSHCLDKRENHPDKYPRQPSPVYRPTTKSQEETGSCKYTNRKPGAPLGSFAPCRCRPR